MFQIEIPKRGAVCSQGGESLIPGTEYYSALISAETGAGYVRQDYCQDCWKRTQGKPFDRVCSTWKSTVPRGKETSDLPKKRDERVFYLLREILAKQESPAEAFVLALYLARRRLLFLRQEMIHEGKYPVIIYEVAETEEMICVPSFSLSELQVEQLQVSLAKKLNG